MKVILFGASGMVGQGVLRECLLDPEIAHVLAVGRSPLGQTHPKLRSLGHPNLYDLSSVESELQGYDACFYSLGVSVVGHTEAEYRHLIYDLTLSVAQTLCRLNPGMTFIYVTGRGTDSTEKRGAMWARVKGQTENALLRLPFKAAYMFRPHLIQPLHGITSKTLAYRIPYILLSPVMSLLVKGLPDYATTSERVGRAMIAVAKRGFSAPVIENRDIHRLGI